VLVIRIILVTLCVGGGVAAGYYAMSHARSYARMGNQPEEITAAQAFDVPLDAGPRWVRLKEPLKVNCDHALQELTNGVVDFTEYLGYDATGKYAFLIQYKGDTNCAGTQAVPWEGLLKSPPMYWWTINHMPDPNSEPVELKLQANPTEELKEAIGAFVALVMLIGSAAVFAWARPPKPKSPQQHFQARAAASGR
jgi:hypothetical protein